MRKPGISETRENILKFIQGFIDERGYAPTVRDIMKGCNLSSTALVQHHLNILEREGHIHRDPRVVRSIQLMEKDIVEVPLLGAIAAGKPIPVPNSDSWVRAAEEMLKLTTDVVGNRGNIYALRVKGTSMLDALVNDGDIVIMESAQTAEDGEMVAVWLKDEQEVTLKKIYRESGRIRLQPANSEVEPIYTKPENVEVQGKVVAILRRLDH
ncbi:MAG: repressor LexA [Chloroflexi bacterium CG07_land_8_20_14_0_80_45_17]|nr:MAG: repressor LexA [Chloroflexi bacterium CG07_land_8_20_14_0_80_45_17]